MHTYPSPYRHASVNKSLMILRMIIGISETEHTHTLDARSQTSALEKALASGRNVYISSRYSNLCLRLQDVHACLVCVCIHACFMRSMYTCTHACFSVRMHVCMCYVHACVCVSMFVCMYAKCVYVRMCVWMHVCMNVRMCACEMHVECACLNSRHGRLMRTR